MIKRLKTAADGSLATEYQRDRIFVTNSRTTKFLSKWSTVEEIAAQMDVLRAQNREFKEERASRRERDSHIESLH